MLISNALGNAQTIAQTAVSSGGAAAIQQALQNRLPARARTGAAHFDPTGDMPITPTVPTGIVSPNAPPPALTPTAPGLAPPPALTPTTKTPLVLLGVAVVGAIAFAVVKHRRRAA